MTELYSTAAAPSKAPAIRQTKSGEQNGGSLQASQLWPELEQQVAVSASQFKRRSAQQQGLRSINRSHMAFFDTSCWFHTAAVNVAAAVAYDSSAYYVIQYIQLIIGFNSKL